MLSGTFFCHNREYFRLLNGRNNTANPECLPSIWLHIRARPYFHGATCTFNYSQINRNSIGFDRGHRSLQVHYSLGIVKFDTLSNLVLTLGITHLLYCILGLSHRTLAVIKIGIIVVEHLKEHCTPTSY